MAGVKPITIIGGGLAGLTLGIALRQRSVPVVIWEMGQYPRHRVCGEFISGNGQETLGRLGLLDLLLAAGARPANTVAFFSREKSFHIRSLPKPALCLSRFRLDALLAEELQKLGGDLRCGSRWSQTESQVEEGIVRATGRRVQANPDAEGWHWFGLKAHVVNLALTADLEMHLALRGYVGLCRLDKNKVNVCGLFRRRKGDAAPVRSVAERLRGEPGSLLFQRLAEAQFEDDSLCAVSGLTLKPHRASNSQECCVGDSITMIPPVTGNGMSMAFESAELGAGPLAHYARGEVTWESAKQAIARQCDRAFTSRLAWARRLQDALFSATVQEQVLPLAFKWQPLWRLFFVNTR